MHLDTSIYLRCIRKGKYLLVVAFLDELLHKPFHATFRRNGRENMCDGIYLTKDIVLVNLELSFAAILLYLHLASYHLFHPLCSFADQIL